MRVIQITKTKQGTQVTLKSYKTHKLETVTYISKWRAIANQIAKDQQIYDPISDIKISGNEVQISYSKPEENG